tara:strand:+ start:4508 stop:4723 length:216 start_codon:yes stop_codon:yes gene_type:complete
MGEKQLSKKMLFEIAIKYVEKGYNTEDLRYGDDLYDASPENIKECIEIFHEIRENGLKWANEHVKTLKTLY